MPRVIVYGRGGRSPTFLGDNFSLPMISPPFYLPHSEPLHWFPRHYCGAAAGLHMSRNNTLIGCSTYHGSDTSITIIISIVIATAIVVVGHIIITFVAVDVIW
jgi:hypothetical protein